MWVEPNITFIGILKIKYGYMEIDVFPSLVSSLN